jgi:uncharacterized protein (TIGR03435 family)
MLSTAIGLAQAPVNQPRFEVASIKPHPADDRRIILGPSPGGRFRALGATLKNLIMVAYQVEDFQIFSVPNGMSSNRYDIVAKTEDGSNSKWTECLQSLLEDRFKLKIHRETKEMPIYALALAKNGLKLKETKEECPSLASPPSAQPPGNSPATPCGGLMGIWNRVSGTNIPMDQIVDSLSKNLGRRVVDRTGLTGRYDVRLEWTPDETQTWFLPFAPPPSSDGSGPSIYTALQEQLGLKLESQKGPVEAFVIDHVEKPSED